MVGDGRMEELRNLGLAEPLVRTAAGEVLHDGLWSVCLPVPPAAPERPAPAGVRFIPLWQFCGGVTGVLLRDGRLEFAEYAIDVPEARFEFLAATEQGLLARVLSQVADEHLAGAAESVGFRFLAELRAARDAGIADSAESVRALVRGIDARCLGSGTTA